MKARIAWPLLAINFLLTPALGVAGGDSSFQQALALAQKGRKSEALELFHRLTSEDSTNLEAWNNRASLEAALGNLDAARASLEHALAVRPDLAVLSRNLEKVRSRQARLAYDSAFGTASKLQPLVLEFRRSSGPESEVGLRRERDSLRTVVAFARDEARSIAQMRDSLSWKDREIARLRGIQATPGTLVVASAEPVSKSDSPIASPPQTAPRTRPSIPLAAPPDVLDAVKAWSKAWSDRDVEAYISCYTPDYHPPGTTREEWEGKRRDRIRAPTWIKVEVLDPKLTRSAPDRAEVVYRQVYQTEETRLTSRKKIGLTLVRGDWKIVEEKESR